MTDGRGWTAGNWRRLDERVSVPHLDGDVRIAPTGVLRRAEREEIEDAHLAPGATRAVGAGERLVPEEPDPLRTCFQRDVDRIRHSPAFRRTAGKTQVFVWNEDHQRTRLTHTLEVAQIAEAVARACRLNTDLVNAIALGHDLGHGPFGHASEPALSGLVDGGFDHALWGADVTAVPLNLTRQTLDGIRNHSWALPTPTTPEGVVCSIADRVGYLCHDLEDAFIAGIVTPGDFPSELRPIVATRRSRLTGELIDAIVNVIAETGVIGFETEAGEALQRVRDFAYDRVYHRDESISQGEAVREFLPRLVRYLAENAPDLVEAPAGADDDVRLRHAVAYVAGATDRWTIRVADAQGVAVPDVLRAHAV